MKRIFGWWMVWIGLASGSGQAQDPCSLRLSGVVVDGETNQPFPGVSVVVEETKKGLFTDDRGHFVLDGFCPEGTYTVQYTMVGYKPFKARYHFHGAIQDKIMLHTDTCQLESVTIVGAKDEALGSYTKTTLEGKNLDRTRGLSLGEALKELPGMNSFRTGTSISKPVIHGLHSNRILTLNAGLRQEGQQWGNEHAPEIDPFVSDKLQVIKGAAGVRYGPDALGGVILVEPRPLRAQRGMAAELQAVGMSNNRQGVASAMVEGKWDKVLPLSWRVQGSLQQAGNTRTPRYFQANTGFQSQNFSYQVGMARKRWGWELFYSQFNTRLGIFSGAHIGSYQDLLAAIQKSAPAVTSDFTYAIERPFQRVEHELVRLKAWYQVGGLGKLSVLAGRQYNDRSEFDVLRSSSANAQKDNPQLQFKLTTHSADLVLEHRPIGHFTGTVGLTWMRQGNVWQGRFLVPNYLSHNYGIFWLEKWTRGRWELEAGTRYDLRSMDIFLNNGGIVGKTPYTFQNFSSAVGANVRLNNHLTAKVTVGTAWRPPSVSELYSKGLHHGAGAIEYGRTSLQPEKATKAVASLEVSTKRLAFEGTLHYSYIQDFIYLQPRIAQLVNNGSTTTVYAFEPTIRGVFPVFDYTQANAHFYGSDLSADYSLTEHWSLLGKGTWVLSYNLSRDSYLINTPPFRYSLGVQHNLALAIGQGHVQAYARVTVQHTAQQTRVSAFTDFADPPKGYTLFDAEIGADIPYGKRSMTITLQGTNLFDTVYRDYLNRFRYYTDEMGRNLLLRIKVPIGLYGDTPSSPN